MPLWDDDDWPNNQSESGAGDEAPSETDYTADVMQKQYDYASFSEITPDPVLCAPFHEDSGSTATDVAGTNDGTINGVTLGATGLLGATAYDFDGTDDYVQFSSLASTITGNYTVAVWFKVSVSDLGRLYEQETSNGFHSAIINNPNDGDISLYDGSGSNNLIADTADWSDGSWHQVVLVRDSDAGTRYIYVDGTEEASGSTTSGSSSESDFFVGARPDNTQNLGGRATDLRVYDTALSASQIQTLYDVVDTDGSFTTSVKSG